MIPVAAFLIFGQPHWPTVRDGTYVRRFPAHPLVCWLARWLPIDPYVDVEYPRYRDADPLVDARAGIIYCSVAQAETLKRELRDGG